MSVDQPAPDVGDGLKREAIVRAKRPTSLAQVAELAAAGASFDRCLANFLDEFASPLASLRAVLLFESPAPFRARNLFVSENALARA